MMNILSKFKIIFYLSNILLIIEYLFPGSLLGCILFNDCKIQPQITRDFIISSNHFYSFFILTYLGLISYNSNKQKKFLLLYLLCLAVILELFHLIIPNRNFEYQDLIGNVFGVAVVLLLNYFIRNYVKFKN
jgi:VanZ family protein